MAKFANIIIDISLDKLDHSFQYKIPMSLAREVTPGVLVEVPFGKADVLRRGYVVEVTDIPEFDLARMKEIAAVVTEGIPIESQMITLAIWMRENFGGTLNQALRTVLPVKEKENHRNQRWVQLLLSAEEAREALARFQQKHQVARARLMEALMQQSPLPYEELTGKHRITAKVMQAMTEQGIIRVQSVRSYRNPLQDMSAFGEVVRLNPQQERIAREIHQRRGQGDLRPSLLHGVTGSGKTEVYIALIEEAIRQGEQAIVLIPEIALTFQTVARFYRHFGDRVSILHSRLSAGERYDQFERAKSGELDVMIGPRSALFTPFARLGYIIIDEEHEASYKSEAVPCYHARETAIARAGLCGASVVLGSATPSVESYYRAQQGEYVLYEMKQRISHRPLPRVYVEDLRKELRMGNRSVLSKRLRGLMEDRLERGEQMMLFLNRRGMAGFVSCRSCGEVIKCPHCDVSLHLHNNGKLICHYCGFRRPMVTSCPSCASSYVGTFKAGTQKIQEYLSREFPQARVLRMDLDTTRQKDSYEKILSAFAAGEADILLGTQMIVKGHDFPKVTLVGVLAADLSLGISDYRAAERTFQLLTQAAGRAGRGERPGEVVFQTYQPEHFAVELAAKQDYPAFYQREIAFRQLMHYPPIHHLLVIHLASKQEGLVKEASDVLQCELAEKIRRDFARAGLVLIGPADAPIARINDVYRKVIYIKGGDYGQLVQLKNRVDALVQSEPVFSRVSIQFDFNPMNGF